MRALPSTDEGADETTPGRHINNHNLIPCRTHQLAPTLECGRIPTLWAQLASIRRMPDLPPFWCSALRANLELPIEIWRSRAV